DAELPARRRLIEDVSRRQYFQSFKRRGAGRIIAGALGNPAEEQFILRIAGHQSLAALVRHLPGGFLEKEASGRIGPIQRAAVDLARQSEDVEGRMVAAETEAKAVLAAGRAVTSAGVASGPR